MQSKAIFIIFLALGLGHAVAQSPSPPDEARQLQDKLKQLEEETQQLKARIAALEKSQQPAPQVVNATIHQPAQPADSSVPANSPDSKTTNPQPAGNVTLAPTTQSSQTDTSKTEATPTMNIYGFAMLDMGYQFKTNDPAWFDTNRPSKLPSFDHQFGANGNTYFSVRQSRFGVKGTLPTDWGDANYKFEFDMYGVGKDAGLTTIRPRHFYGELGHFLAGQTNSTFMDIDVFPNILDYWGPNGMVFLRNPQFRWMPIKGDTHLWISIEAPGQSGDQGLLSDREPVQNITAHFPYPDIAAQYRYSGKGGYIQGAGVVRYVKLDDTLVDAFDLNQSIVGWGFNFSSGLKLGKDILHLQYVVGNGIENYMNDAPFDVAPIANFGNPVRPVKGKPLPMWSYVIYLDHNWSDQWTSSLGFSALQIQNTSLQAANAYHRGQYSSINLLHTPTKHILYGAELLFGRRVNARDNFEPQDYRVQFSFKYSFDERVFGPKEQK